MPTDTTLEDQKYLTLTPNVIGTITLDADYHEVLVYNWTGEAAVFFKVMDQDSADPVILGSDSQGLPASVSSVLIDAGGQAFTGVTVINFISTAAVTVSAVGNRRRSSILEFGAQPAPIHVPTAPDVGPTHQFILDNAQFWLASQDINSGQTWPNRIDGVSDAIMGNDTSVETSDPTPSLSTTPKHLLFDGIDDKVSIPDIGGTLHPHQNTGSLSIVVTFEYVSGSTNRIVLRLNTPGGAGNDYIGFLFLSTTRVRCGIDGTTSTVQYSPAIFIDPGEKITMAITLDGATMSVMSVLNGEAATLAGTLAITPSNYGSSAEGFQKGTLSSNGNFKGSDVIIFPTKIITLDELKDLDTFLWTADY